VTIGTKYLICLKRVSWWFVHRLVIMVDYPMLYSRCLLSMCLFLLVQLEGFILLSEALRRACLKRYVGLVRCCIRSYAPDTVFVIFIRVFLVICFVSCVS